MMHTLDFGGYSAYIFGAYAAFFLVFALQALGLRLQSRRVRNTIKQGRVGKGAIAPCPPIAKKSIVKKSIVKASKELEKNETP